MKAKIRPHNLTQERRDALDEIAREYVEKKKEDLLREIRWAVARRWTLALALSLSDHYGFKYDKINKVTGGLEDILCGIAEEVMENGGNVQHPDGSDDDCDLMMRELIDRGIEIEFEGDPAYGDMGTICERLGIERYGTKIRKITEITENIGDMVSENFAINLKKLRTKRGLSQGAIAEAIGTSKASIGYYENGYRMPGLDIAAKIAIYFGVSIEELIGLDVKKKKPSGVGASESKTK